jgi:hypothetical protein
MKRRTFIETGAAAAAGIVLSTSRLLQTAPKVRVTGFELLPVRATARTVWLIVRLRTDAGLNGLGEASDAFGFANTTVQDAAKMQSELQGFFEMVKGVAARYRSVSCPWRADCRKGRSRFRNGIQRDRASALGPVGQGARCTHIFALRR